MKMKPTLSVLLAATALSACAVGPNYHRPSAPVSPAFKETAGGWIPAAPADALDRGDWWTLFNDPVLSALEQKVQISNQNIIAAEAAYREAQAVVKEDQAQLFPTVALTGTGTESGGGRGSGGTIVGSVVSGAAGATARQYRANLGATWAPDLWGRVRREIEGAKANAQVNEATLANAQLSAQGELATDYFGLRQVDVAIDIENRIIADYQRALTITRNRFNAGIAPHSDALQAETQLENAQSDLAGLTQQRADFEHAMAVLTGQAPANFSLTPVASWTPIVPVIPPGVPSTLLQRRPDIAAAERRVADANAQIGVQVSAYFPSVTLTGSYGYSARELGSLFSASNNIWSFGLTAAETLLDFGARRAAVNQAKAAHDQSVAQYRETVLEALQDVEDRLAATRVLAQQEVLQQQAFDAADQVQKMMANRYAAGQIAYTDVVTAQTTAYNAQRALIQTGAQRQSTAVALIQALGGGWHAPHSPPPPAATGR
jgi:NodT family efflux transporter outer membrane factor (OMF) lipoprotein